MTIKTIVLDLGGVMFTDGTKLAFMRMRDLFNIEKMKDVKTLLTIFSNTPNSPGHDIRLGLISMDTFEQKFASALNIPDDKIHLIRHLWFGAYVMNYKMDEIVKQLREKYRVIAFTGNIRERIKYMDNRYDFLKYFHDTVFSYDYQMNKGEIEFYEEMVKHLDCEPHEAIMIDDEMSNLEKAESLGLNIIHFLYTEQLIEELKNFDIKINL